jgi:hypothetical protein
MTSGDVQISHPPRLRDTKMVLADLDFNSREDWETAYLQALWLFVPWLFMLHTPHDSYETYDAINDTDDDPTVFWIANPEDDGLTRIMYGFLNTVLSIPLSVMELLHGRALPFAAHLAVRFAENACVLIAYWQFVVNDPDNSAAFFDWAGGLVFALAPISLFQTYAQFYGASALLAGFFAALFQAAHVATLWWLYGRYHLHFGTHNYMATWIVVAAGLSVIEFASALVFAVTHVSWLKSEDRTKLLQAEKAIAIHRKLDARQLDNGLAQEQSKRRSALASMRSSNYGPYRISRNARGSNLPRLPETTGRSKGVKSGKGQRQTSQI